MDLINPVTLISGATGMGALEIREIAHRSSGGLLLVDASDDALASLADDLEAHHAAPERMSTLALDVTDEARWTQAADFIRSQYGRLDWALICAAPPKVDTSELVDFGQPRLREIDGVAPAMNAVASVMQQSTSGGAILLSLPRETMRNEIPGLVRAAAAGAARDKIKLNALTFAGPATAAWSAAPYFSDLLAETGGPRGAFERIASMETPLARFAADQDIARLIIALLADDSPMTGATLIVDGAATL